MTRIAAQLDAGKNVAVHCRQGAGRSGMIEAGVLVTSGASPEEALQAVSSARGAEVPETLEQRRWMQQLPSRLAVTKS
jgi:protein-tyrosine phosphatase